MNNTIFRTVQILKYVASREHGSTLQEIASEFNIPKSSAFVIVQSLLELHFLAHCPFNEKCYCLGIEAFTLGIQYFNHLDVVSHCIEYTKPLADKYSKTVFVSALNETKIAFVGKYVAPTAVLATCALGSSKDVYATAGGKAILAFLPAEERNEILDKIEFASRTEYTINSRETLEQELEATRQRGYALERQEDRSISSCCAAPIYDFSGKVIFAVSLSDVYNPAIDNEQMGKDLQNTAAELSRSLGYTTQR